MTKRKAIFLDRDGTIIVDCHYLRDPSKVELLPWAVEGLREFQQLGYELFVVTNQSGVARGLFTMRDVHLVNLQMEALLRKAGIHIQAIRICPHYPEGTVLPYAIACACRKPLPGMLFQLAEEFSIDLADSLMIGDRESDVRAGIAAGCRSVLLAPKMPADRKRSDSVLLPDLLAVATWLKLASAGHSHEKEW